MVYYFVSPLSFILNPRSIINKEMPVIFPLQLLEKRIYILKA